MRLHTFTRNSWGIVILLALAMWLAGVGTAQAQSNISVTLTPQVITGLTIGQATSVTATLVNDTQNEGVSWSATGGSFSANASLSGVATTYTAPATAGVYSLTATSVADGSKTATVTFGVTDVAGVFTYHNNLSRNGSNPSEYNLIPSNVTSTTFGKLFSCTVDGAIYAQPLWVANLMVNGAKHNVILVATQHDSLYAFDGDFNTNPCTALWHVSLIDSLHGGSSMETAVPSGVTGYLVGQGAGDITPEVGVTGTPVIDPTTNMLYVVSKSVNTSSLTIYQRLHAIDITTGGERTGNSPVTIAGTYPGTGDGGKTDTFSPQQENQRAGLALVNGIIYIAWGSHEDTSPWYGWMMSYTAATLAPAAVFNDVPNVRQGGIWMGGGAPSADSSNNLYLLTGNGGFDATNASAPNNDYGDCFLKLSSNLTVSSYFTPSDQSNDDLNDLDFGSGGSAILVDQPNSPTPRLVIGGGKDGYLYLLSRDALGGSGDTKAWQRFSFGQGIYATGAFWNNFFYLAGNGGPLQAYSFNTVMGTFNTPNASQSTASYGFPGSTPSVSSTGNSNGIVWALDNGSYCTAQSSGCGPTILHAYDATNLTNELWNSTQGTGNTPGNAVKFTVPTVANGKVYVGTRGNNIGGSTTSTSVAGELDVYGLLGGTKQAATPTFSLPAGTYAGTQSVSISDATAGAIIYYTTNGSTPTTQSTIYAGAITVSSTTTLQAVAAGPGIIASALAKATYTISATGTAPAISAISPNSAMQGQLNLTEMITGSNFLSGPVCTFGSGITVNSCTFVSSTQIDANIAIAANAMVGTNTVIVTDTDGQVATLTNGFTIALNTNPTAAILVNAGGPAYTDSLGQLWNADKDFSGGSPENTTHAIANTADPTLYQTERYNNGNFSYTFTVPNGSYNVVLKFAEIYWKAVGQRVFNVAINGAPVLTNFDIIAAAGANYTAVDKLFTIATTTGAITVQFSNGSANYPKISAIEVSPASGVSVQVTPPTASLFATQQQQFTSTVVGSSNTAVTWSYSPQVGTLTAGGLYTAPASITAMQSVVVTATSQADTTKSASATVSLLPPAAAFNPIYINSGGPAYTDTLGNNWLADADFAGGSEASTTKAIANTTDPTLYQTERYGNSTYTFTVAPGKYNVVLKFAEIYWTSAGQRIFNVAINGSPVLSNFDIIAAAGAPLTAIDETFPVTVTGSSITVQFSTGSADLPKISAIAIKAGSPVSIQINPASVALAAGQSQQFGATVTGSTNTGVTWSYSPQVGTLVTSGATAGLYTAPGTITAAQNVSVTATSAAAPTQASSAVVNLVPPFSPILVDSGGLAYTDSLGQNWSVDTGFTGGNEASTASNVLNSSDPKLYQTERWGAFSYKFTVPNGNYNVVLKFAEIYWTKAGQRVFNVSINGTQVLTNFDIIAAAGAPLTAIDKTFPVTVTNSTVTVQFTVGTADQPKVSAIEIH
jgi:hypothetical protein